MMEMFQLILLILFLFKLPVTNGDCVQNEYCHCVNDGVFTDLYCRSTFPYLEVIGGDIKFRQFHISAEENDTRLEGKFKNIQVNHIVIRGKNVAELDCLLLSGLMGLTSVSIIGTKLSSIPTCAIPVNSNIRSMVIIDSQIHELPRRALAVLPRLQTFVLSHSCLSSTKVDTFHGIDNLISLDLSFNCLSGFFSIEPLTHLTKLTYLNVSHNKVSFLNLTFLDLFNSSGSNDFPQSKPNVSRTLFINFAWNQIKTIYRLHVHLRPIVPDNITINVDLSHNELKRVPEVSLDEPKESDISVDLDISYNHVSIFDRDPVSCNVCHNVILRVSIAYNTLTSFPLCPMHILQKYNSHRFNFSHNLIQGRVNQLCGSEYLYILDVSFNRISSVGVLGYKGKTSRLRELYMSGNNISDIEKSEIINVASTLKMVDLAKNSLSDYIQILRSFPSTMNRIALAGNQFNCTSNDFIVGTETICQSSSLLHGARCARPTIFRGMQVLCLPSFNCSSVLNCAKDPYVEVSLNSKVSNGVLTINWEVIGPGEDKVSEFILTVRNIDLNITRIDLFVHRLSRNFTVAPISSNVRYASCVEAVVLNMPSEPSCTLVENAEEEDVSGNPVVLPIVLVIGITIILIGINLFVWWVYKRRRRAINQTNPKQVACEGGPPSVVYIDISRNEENYSFHPDDIPTDSPVVGKISPTKVYDSPVSPVSPVKTQTLNQLVTDNLYSTDVQINPSACGEQINYLTPSNEDATVESPCSDTDVSESAISLETPIVSSLYSESTLLADEDSDSTIPKTLFSIKSDDYQRMKTPCLTNYVNETNERNGYNDFDSSGSEQSLRTPPQKHKRIHKPSKAHHKKTVLTSSSNTARSAKLDCANELAVLKPPNKTPASAKLDSPNDLTVLKSPNNTVTSDKLDIPNDLTVLNSPNNTVTSTKRDSHNDLAVINTQSNTVTPDKMDIPNDLCRHSTGINCENPTTGDSSSLSCAFSSEEYFVNQSLGILNPAFESSISDV